jgi:hypothetical protein
MIRLLAEVGKRGCMGKGTRLSHASPSPRAPISDKIFYFCKRSIVPDLAPLKIAIAGKLFLLISASIPICKYLKISVAILATIHSPTYSQVFFATLKLLKENFYLGASFF